MRGLRARVALVALVATAVALSCVLLLVRPGLRERALAHLQASLLAEARLMARVVREPLAHGTSTAELDALVDTAAREVRARVTVVAPDGRVLADSALSGRALAEVENHRDRPEVKAALALGTGESVRRSATLDAELLYEAVVVRDDAGVTLGVVRVALPLTDAAAEASDLVRAVGAALLVSFLLTALLSALLASGLAGPLQGLLDSARRLAAGDLSVRVPVRRSDELGELAAILNQAAEQLQQRLSEGSRERARTEAVLSAMDDAMLAVDARGRVVLANDAMRRWLGGPDPLGRPYVELIRQREVGDAVERVLRTGERVVLDEVRLRQAARSYALTAVPFPAPEGESTGAVLTLHDVTERRRLEQVRRDFVANASHELRTPLTSIRGFVEALEDGASQDAEKGPRFLGKIHRHADQMAALVDDLLELSRLEAGDRPPDAAPLALADVAAEVAASFDERARRKGIRLTVRDLGAPVVESDAQRVGRIAANLVENAVKYTPEGGAVSVATHAGPAGEALLTIEDDGPGIAPEHLPRLFERFYRVDKARSRDEGGTGLGLAIVKHLAESLGARVHVASEVGRGTRVTLTVPVRRPVSRP
jgi:two-component system phosphate regulon sensor histidine kinase PhoR